MCFDFLLFFVVREVVQNTNALIFKKYFLVFVQLPSVYLDTELQLQV